MRQLQCQAVRALFGAQNLPHKFVSARAVQPLAMQPQPQTQHFAHTPCPQRSQDGKIKSF